MYTNFYAFPEMMVQVEFRATFDEKLRIDIVNKSSHKDRTGTYQDSVSALDQNMLCFIFTRIQAAAISSAVSRPTMFSSTSVWSPSTEMFFSLQIGILIVTDSLVPRPLASTLSAVYRRTFLAAAARNFLLGANLLFTDWNLAAS